MLHGVLAAQENLGPWGGTNANPMGLSILPHSSERWSLIYWRIPGFLIRPSFFDMPNKLGDALAVLGMLDARFGNVDNGCVTP